MIFQSPQWQWRAEDGPVDYGFVRNVVGIYPTNRKRAKAYVVVPTELFQLLPFVFSAEQNAHLAVVGAHFYLDEVEKVWVFGVEAIDGSCAIDLWPYIKSKLPNWVDLALRAKH
jgi:hypothetical protein